MLCLLTMLNASGVYQDPLSSPTRRSSDLYPLRRSGDKIPIYGRIVAVADVFDALMSDRPYRGAWDELNARELDRKSTRLNSSHVRISYAVFCLKKKKTIVRYKLSLLLFTS